MTTSERQFVTTLASCLEEAGWLRDPKGNYAWSAPGLGLDVRPLSGRAVSLRQGGRSPRAVSSSTDQGPIVAAIEVAHQLHRIREEATVAAAAKAEKGGAPCS